MSKTSDLETTQDGRMWATLSYGGMFLGFPLGIIPLIQREDAFAVFHAKHATASYLAFIVAYFGMFTVASVFFMITCGISNLFFIPLLMLMMLWPVTTTVHGLVLAMNGEWKAPLGSFGLGDRLFGNIELELKGDDKEE